MPSEAVSHKIVILLSIKYFSKYFTSSNFSFGIKYKENPFNNAPHISKVHASKTIEPVCKICSLFSNFINLVFFTSRTIFLLQTITPFGLPVEPEVYIIYAISSGDPIIFGLDFELELLYIFRLDKSTKILGIFAIMLFSKCLVVKIILVSELDKI